MSRNVKLRNSKLFRNSFFSILPYIVGLEFITFRRATIPLLDKFGRKTVLSYAFFVCGFFMIVSTALIELSGPGSILIEISKVNHSTLEQVKLILYSGVYSVESLQSCVHFQLNMSQWANFIKGFTLLPISVELKKIFF